VDWEQELKNVKAAYDNAPDQSQPIAPHKYVTLLTAFGSLVPLADISDSLDTDLRRNLPGGGMRGLGSVPAMHDRIADAGAFAMTNKIYSLAGSALADNLIAVVRLVSPNKAQMALGPIHGVLQDLANGNL
jgi:hypothetical protein